MACRATGPNGTNGAFEIDTWSGKGKAGKKPQLVCTIGDQTEAYHFVEVTNYKTLDLTIHVVGEITSASNNAKFQGPPIIYEKEWQESRKIHGTYGSNVETFSGASIAKKVSGSETIEVRLEYDDYWTNQKKSATPTANPWVFKVTLS